MIGVSLRTNQGTIQSRTDLFKENVWAKLFVGQSLVASTTLSPFTSLSANSTSKKL